MTPYQAMRPCPLCGETTVDQLHEMRFEVAAAFPLPARYNVVGCTECGFVYADTVGTQVDYDRYYAEFSKYEDPSIATGGGDSPVDQRRMEEMADRIAERMPLSARILDMGCAGGGLLSALRARGFKRLHGADGAASCIARVRQLGFEATCVPFTTIGALEKSGPYDLIILSHVLEHILAPRDLISAVASLLAPGGQVYAETPDASRYNDYPFVPFYFFDCEHINHFNIHHLASLGEASGLALSQAEQIEIEVAPEVLYPACWVWISSKQSKSGIERTPPLTDLVSGYVKRCREKTTFPELAALSATNLPVIVWGAGAFAQRLFGNNLLDRKKIVAVVDRDKNKQGRNFAGFTVESPESALAAFPAALVVVAAALNGKSIAEDVRRIAPEARAIVFGA